MENLIIQVDTREQAGKNQNVLDYFAIHKIKTIRSKLFVGDYTLLHDQTIAVDKKKDMLEIANCICGSSHERFRNELIRAKENNIKLYILIEDEYIYNLDGVKYYKCPTFKSNQYKVVGGRKILMHKVGEKRTQVNFETLGKAMKTMEEKYGCKFVFSKRNDFGKTIVDILTRKRDK